MASPPFANKSAMTPRSPSRIELTNQSKDDQERLKKRKHDQLVSDEPEEYSKKVSLEDIYNLIQMKSSQDSKERQLIKEELSSEIQEINKKIKSMEQNIQAIDQKVNNVTNLAQQNSNLINNLFQEKIEKCMEIDGIHNRLFDECQDLKKLAIETIESFKINVQEIDIDRVTKKNVQIKIGEGQKKDKTIMTVYFKDFETKLRVMREKRSIKDDREIYFNAALTHTNRSMMSSVRKIASKKNLKVFFKNGNVHVEKQNKDIMKIENENDLMKLKQYVEGIQTSIHTQSTSRN